MRKLLGRLVINLHKKILVLRAADFFVQVDAKPNAFFAWEKDGEGKLPNPRLSNVELDWNSAPVEIRNVSLFLPCDAVINLDVIETVSF